MLTESHEPVSASIRLSVVVRGHGYSLGEWYRRTVDAAGGDCLLGGARWAPTRLPRRLRSLARCARASKVEILYLLPPRRSQALDGSSRETRPALTGSSSTRPSRHPDVPPARARTRCHQPPGPVLGLGADTKRAEHARSMGRLVEGPPRRSTALRYHGPVEFL